MARDEDDKTQGAQSKPGYSPYGGGAGDDKGRQPQGPRPEPDKSHPATGAGKRTDRKSSSKAGAQQIADGIARQEQAVREAAARDQVGGMHPAGLTPAVVDYTSAIVGDDDDVPRDQTLVLSFPRALRLLNHGHTFSFPKGTHRVRRHAVEEPDPTHRPRENEERRKRLHWYLEQHGVELFEKPAERREDGRGNGDQGKGTSAAGTAGSQRK